jgi:pilus assembly protein CpaC
VRTIAILFLSAAAVIASAAGSTGPQGDSDVTVPVNKSIVLERPDGIRRISVSNPEIAEAVAVSSTEILVNGKNSGETNLIVWDSKGNRATFDIHVQGDSKGVDSVRSELARELGPSVSVDQEGKTVFLRGTVNDPISADRAVNIASALGTVVNLLRVTVPASAPQILLKVRFASVSRSAAEQFGVNIFSLNQKGIATSTTSQFGQSPNISYPNANTTFQDLLNIFYYRPDLNIGAFIQALEAKNILQILAEPNLLTVSGEEASFLAGGEFPFPTIQGGAGGVGQITIQFKEFGIRLNFLPIITPRGSILLKVTPEVSSLDYSNGLTVNGFSVPASLRAESKRK